MLETNIRIVRPGADIFVWTRTATVSGANLTRDLVEKACGALRHRHGLAAVPSPGSPSTLIVAAKEPIKPIHLDGDEWVLDVADDAQAAMQLTLSSPNGTDLVADLIERAFLARIAAVTDLWTLDSPRIWYESEPFCVKEGIGAYRRYEIGTLMLNDVGIGLAVDVGVTFFSTETLAYFFAPNVAPDERKRRETSFMQLIRRQDGQKGTLLYDYGQGRSKCYFESAPAGMTCATTGPVGTKRESYPSLLAYYQARNKELPVTASAQAVRVSFKGLEHPQPVAADRVKVRIMNDNVPDSLQDVDKFTPNDRRDLVTQFWSRLEPKPLGTVAPGVESGYWLPGPERVIQFAMPSLIYGGNQVLPAPDSISAETYKEHFRQRLQYLKKAGCYWVPPNLTRKLYCAYPNHIDKEGAKQLATDVVQAISRWTGKPMTAEITGYNSISDAVEQLRDAEKTGMVLFILNEEPAAYYEAEFQLPGWHIKRVTEEALTEHYRYLSEGARNPREHAKTLDAGKKRWIGFINPIILAVIQLLEIIPYRIDQAGPYEAQLIVDVGHDRRHFAVSLLIARSNTKSPSFRLFSHTQDKVDNQQEAINPKILADEIVDLFDRLPRRFDPIESLLIMRDGRIVKQEPEGLNNAIARLRAKGYLTATSHVDWVDIHKDTLKSVRIWDVNAGGLADNPLLGTGIRLNQGMIVLATTGIPTLTQATADPLLIVSNGRCLDVMNAARANFAGAQLNWSSPRVAQRLHVGMKRTDEDLKSRAAQEVRRLR